MTNYSSVRRDRTDGSEGGSGRELTTNGSGALDNGAWPPSPAPPARLQIAPHAAPKASPLRQTHLRRGDRRFPLSPPLLQYPGEEAEPHLVIQRDDFVSSYAGADEVRHMVGERSIHVSRYTRDLRDLRKVVARIIRRIHVDAQLCEQNRAAYAVPVVPPPEVGLLQAFGFDHVVDGHFRHIETAQTGGSCAQVPFALRLVSQRPGFPSQSVVEQLQLFECLSLRGGI